MAVEVFGFSLYQLIRSVSGLECDLDRVTFHLHVSVSLNSKDNSLPF